ncbi:MAG: SpoIID/LytB domain-containing protein [Cyanobacteria bacterium P01_H01_bin.74]
MAFQPVLMISKLAVNWADGLKKAVTERYARYDSAYFLSRSLSLYLMTSLLVIGGSVALTQDANAQAQSLQSGVQKAAPFRDANILRVGISDDAMTAWEYPSTEITCKGSFTVSDRDSNQLLLTAAPNETLTFKVTGSGFSIRRKGTVSITNGLVPINSDPDLDGSTEALLQPVVPQKTASLPFAPDSVWPLPSNFIFLAKVQPLASQIAAFPRTGTFDNVAGPLWVQPINPENKLAITNITRKKKTPTYRGAFEIVRASSSPSKLSVVNVIELEDYLKAVVPNELPIRYGAEAVKAQSIAARNYALHPREKPWKTFDICDSQLCQVYLGAQTETPGSNTAIRDTSGLIALYYGDPILALFSSAHGGVAENYSYVFSDPKTKQFPAPTIPYLMGGPDIPFNRPLDLSTEKGCRMFFTSKSFPSFDVNSPYYRWTKKWSIQELTAQINKGLLDVSTDTSTNAFVKPLFSEGQKIGRLKRLHVLQRGNSGKAMALEIVASNGRWTLQKEFLIRKVLQKDNRFLPSANVVFSHLTNAKKQLVAVKAEGAGFGHGVGMSQLGASWMGRHGYRFPEIIQHYYKGVSIGSVPVMVGENLPNRAVVSRFIVNQSSGKLWLFDSAAQNSDKLYQQNQQAVKVELNGAMLSLRPSGLYSGIDIGQYLKPGQQNTLVLFPDEANPSRRLKAWIDVYPALNQSA